MPEEPHIDWDPRAGRVQDDQLAAYDHMRDTHGVAYSEMLGWSVLGHADVRRVLLDPQTFSSVVSRHVAVPNGMDPPEHTRYRRFIDDYFTPARVASFQPACERITAELLDALRGQREVDFAAVFALPFAVRVQCAFMGWSSAPEPELTAWIKDHNRASLAGDRAQLNVLGQQFAALVARKLALRRANAAETAGDVTSSLMHASIDGQPLDAAAIASIVRNWTVGEIGTIAASVGILAEWLARHPAIQARLRSEPALQAHAIEEILRLHGPLVANRRVTTCPVELHGRQLQPGARVLLHWTSANRDPAVFEDPDAFRWDRDLEPSLLYGVGIHVCPGAGLARMELGIALRALLGAVSAIEPGTSPRRRARYPAMGFEVLPLRLEWT